MAERSANASTHLVIAVSGNLAPGGVRTLASQSLIAAELVQGTGNRVGPATGHRVYARARKVSEGDVVWRDCDYDLIDRIQRNRLRFCTGSGRPACTDSGNSAVRIAEAEHIVIGRAVDRDVVVPEVASGE